MDQLNMRKKSLYEYRVVIFDLDGTLYYQRPFRLRMSGIWRGMSWRIPCGSGIF